MKVGFGLLIQLFNAFQGFKYKVDENADIGSAIMRTSTK